MVQATCLTGYHILSYIFNCLLSLFHSIILDYLTRALRVERKQYQQRFEGQAVFESAEEVKRETPILEQAPAKKKKMTKPERKKERKEIMRKAKEERERKKAEKKALREQAEMEKNVSKPVGSGHA